MVMVVKERTDGKSVTCFSVARNGLDKPTAYSCIQTGSVVIVVEMGTLYHHVMWAEHPETDWAVLKYDLTPIGSSHEPA